jgi:CubicO group peptidase (beta-lactamase class C family)
LLTAIAALQLVEQGTITLDDHAEKYVAEIGKIPILIGFDTGIILYGFLLLPSLLSLPPPSGALS